MTNDATTIATTAAGGGGGLGIGARIFGGLVTLSIALTGALLGVGAMRERGQVSAERVDRVERRQDAMERRLDDSITQIKVSQAEMAADLKNLVRSAERGRGPNGE